MWLINLQKQLVFIESLQKFNPPFWVEAVKFLNYFDRPELYMVLIPFLWIFKGAKEGQKLTWIVALSGLINMSLKTLFALPRPFHLDSSLGILHVHHYGFPSGAAQQAMIFALLMIYLKPKKWVFFFALFYVLVISYSRVYLGVHFPLDILGGWLIGLLCSFLMYWMIPHFDRFFSNRTHLILASLYALLILTFLGKIGSQLASLAFTLIGATLGEYLKKPFSLTQREKIMQFTLSIAGLFIVDLAIPFSFIQNSYALLFLKFCLMGLWINSLSPSFIYFISRFRFSKEKRF